MVKDLKNKINRSKDKIIRTIKRNKAFKTIKSKKVINSIKKNINIETIAVAALLIVFVVIITSLIVNYISPDSDLAATVNGEEITINELNKQYDFFFFLTGYPEEYKQLLTKESFLTQLVNEKILLQEAAEKDISVSDDKIDESIAVSIDRKSVV